MCWHRREFLRHSVDSPPEVTCRPMTLGYFRCPPRMSREIQWHPCPDGADSQPGTEYQSPLLVLVVRGLRGGGTVTGIRSPPEPPLRWRPGMTLDDDVHLQKQSLRWDAAVSSTEVDGDRPCWHVGIRCVRVQRCMLRTHRLFGGSLRRRHRPECRRVCPCVVLGFVA